MTSATPATADQPEQVVEHHEAEALAASAERGHRADTELAAALGRPALAPGGDHRRYLAELGRRAELRPEQERRLSEAAKEGDAPARAALVEAYLPRIASVARIYRGAPAIEHTELLQEGVLGLLQALQQYDPSRGTPFWQYARPWVRRAMQHLSAERTRPFVLSDRALRRLSRLRDAEEDAFHELHRAPTHEELAARSGLTHDQIDHLLSADRAPRSLEAPIETEAGYAGRLEDRVADPWAEDDYDAVLDAAEGAELRALLGRLSETERTILRARFGLDGPEQTAREIADRLGISVNRVRRLERRALRKLAAAAREAGIEP